MVDVLDFSSFGENLNVAVFGATGGIGAVLCKRLSESPSVSKVFTFSKRDSRSKHSKEVWHSFDLKDEKKILNAVSTFTSAPDIVFVATGMLHNDDLGIRPEKALAHLEPDAAIEAFKVNTLGPMLIAKHVFPLFPRDKKCAFAAISARVGSISDNQLGGWYSYRTAKAGLNQMIRTAAIELRRKNRQAVCVAFHPGTVDTGLSKRFQGNIPANKLFTPEFSATSMLNALNHMNGEHSGRLYTWNGDEIFP